jgi:hypothetical protein
MASDARTTPELPADRQCGRCRQSFAGDPDLFQGALPEWWLCPACHERLVGPTRFDTGPTPSERSRP